MSQSGTRPLPRGIVRHRDRYRVRLDVDGRTHSLGVFDRLTDARAALDIARGEVARGTFVPPAQRRAERKAAAQREEAEAVTLAEWAETWLSEMESDSRYSPSTVVSYRSTLRNHVLPDLGGVRLADLTTERVADHLAALARRRSARHPEAKVNGVAPNVVIALRSCLNAAVRRGVGGLAAFKFPEAPKHRRVRPEAVGGDVATPEEVTALTEAMPERLAIAVPLAAWCALRLGEVLGLERRDLEHLDDPARATLHVRRQWNSKAAALTAPKSDSARSVAIPSFLLPALAEHLEAYTGPEPTAPVLTGQRGGRASQTRLDAAWRAARDAVLPGFRFHDLRHTGLTLFAQQGATLAELLHRGGHTDVSVALRYQHATAERDRALTDRLAAVVTGG